MEEIRRCTRCIMPGVLPGVKFDKDSVCNYCKEYDNLFSKLVKHAITPETRIRRYITTSKAIEAKLRLSCNP